MSKIISLFISMYPLFTYSFSTINQVIDPIVSIEIGVFEESGWTSRLKINNTYNICNYNVNGLSHLEQSLFESASTKCYQAATLAQSNPSKWKFSIVSSIYRCSCFLERK